MKNIITIGFLFIGSVLNGQLDPITLVSSDYDYSYDELGRLTEVNINNGCSAYSYANDEVGNRTLATLILNEQNTSGESCACFNEILHIYEDLVSDGILGADEHIILQSNVGPGTNIDMQAGRSIVIKPGVTISAVQKFHARIGPCDNIVQSIISQPIKK